MSDKVKLAIVGCGGMAGAHADHIRNVPDVEVVALCDIKRENLEKFHREKCKADPKIKLYDSIEDLFAHPPEGLRALLIVTPHTCHFPQTMAALAHGYDVLCEKPMVTSSDHARQLTEKITATGRHFQVAFQAPFSQEFAYIRELFQTGALGELQTVTAFSCQSWKTGTANTWRHDPKLSGGGQMYDTGAHLFNSIAWLIDRPVTEVFCWTDYKDMLVDINAAITIRWEGNVLGAVTISGNTPGWQEGIWIAGDKGRVHTGIHGGRLEHYDHRGQLIKYPKVVHPHFTPIGNFVDCLLGRAEPRCPVRYGVLHSWLMDALYVSAREGRPVKVSRPPI